MRRAGAFTSDIEVESDDDDDIFQDAKEFTVMRAAGTEITDRSNKRKKAKKAAESSPMSAQMAFRECDV